MRPLRLFPIALLLTAGAMAAVALSPSASAGCVGRPDDPSQDLACAGLVHYPTGTCVSYFVNPPAPGTSAGGFACQPVPLCGPTICVRNFCIYVPRPMCFIVGVSDVVENLVEDLPA